jgi:hypothetical protein
MSFMANQHFEGLAQSVCAVCDMSYNVLRRLNSPEEYPKKTSFQVNHHTELRLMDSEKVDKEQMNRLVAACTSE